MFCAYIICVQVHSPPTFTAVVLPGCCDAAVVLCSGSSGVIEFMAIKQPTARLVCSSQE